MIVVAVNFSYKLTTGLLVCLALVSLVCCGMEDDGWIWKFEIFSNTCYVKSWKKFILLGVGVFVILVKCVFGCEEVVGWEGTIFLESRSLFFVSLEKKHNYVWSNKNTKKKIINGRLKVRWLKWSFQIKPQTVRRGN